MTVISTPDGWIVTYSAKSKTVLAGPFPTMSEGWRWIDRHAGEPLSPAEKKSDWVTSKILGGSAA